MWNVSRLARCNRGNWLAPTDELNKYRREERAADCRERVCRFNPCASKAGFARGFERTRSRQVATLYNGMFSTDRGLDETEHPFAIYSFDRVSCEFFLPLLFSLALVEMNVRDEALSARIWYICIILLSVFISILRWNPIRIYLRSRS